MPDPEAPCLYCDCPERKHDVAAPSTDNWHYCHGCGRSHVFRPRYKMNAQDGEWAVYDARLDRNVIDHESYQVCANIEYALNHPREAHS